MTRKKASYTERLTSDSALEMSGIEPRMVITLSGLKDEMSDMELTVIFVLVS